MPTGPIPDFDLYAELEVSPLASPETIGAAYRSLARRYHPDAHSASPISDERMRRLNVAYKWLADTASRQLYDESRANQSRPNQSRVPPGARSTRPRPRAAGRSKERVVAGAGHTPVPSRRRDLVWGLC